MIVASDFAQECVFRGLFFGVNSAYLLGVAKLRSNINDDSDGNRIGPFRLTQEEWNANCNNLDFGLKNMPEQITSFRRQCGVFGFMTYNSQNAMQLELNRLPSALELYEKQFGAAQDQNKLVTDLQAAFDATAGLLKPAANAILDDPSQVDAPIVDPKDPTRTGPPSSGGGLFETKAPRIMRRLMSDFGFTKVQAAGILGNFGHETGGFKEFQELHPVSGEGGFGWAQWTGMAVGPPPGRRRAFMNFCAANNVAPTSDEGNYGYLKLELETTEKNTVPAMKATVTLEDATAVFEDKFERAGVVADSSRIKFAHKALTAFENAQPA